MTYMLGMYVNDIAHILIFLAINELVLYTMNFKIPSFWILTITYAFADPLFVYFYAYLCIQARGWNGTNFKFMMGAFDFLVVILGSQESTTAEMSSKGFQKVGDLLMYGGCLNPMWNWVVGLQRELIYTTIHLRKSPDTLVNGSDPMGPYGSGFSETALIWNIGIYFILLLFAIFGCCNRRQKYRDL